VSDLFQDDPPPLAPPPAEGAPLADRLRPQRLDDVVGQEHLTGPEGAIGRMVGAGKLASIILWGPPGTGKTTIARLLADAVGMRFVAISAVFSGVAELKKVFAEAKEHARLGRQTLLFVDEIHRFNRAQQDGFLPYVEDGTVVLVGATTENPSFELNAALLSRAQVLILNRLDAWRARKLAGSWRGADGSSSPPHSGSAVR
jgi:putative ATPase